MAFSRLWRKFLKSSKKHAVFWNMSQICHTFNRKNLIGLHLNRSCMIRSEGPKSKQRCGVSLAIQEFPVIFHLEKTRKIRHWSRVCRLQNPLRAKLVMDFFFCNRIWQVKTFRPFWVYFFTQLLSLNIDVVPLVQCSIEFLSELTNFNPLTNWIHDSGFIVDYCCFRSC